LEPEVSTPEAQVLEDFHVSLIRTTRTCIQYGTCGFAVICILIGAVESFFGR